MSDSTTRPNGADGVQPAAPEVPAFRPAERFWPYVDVPQEPTDEELAALDPGLREVLYGPESRPFAFTIAFPRFEGNDYPRAVDLARRATSYAEIGSGPAFRHRATFRSDAVLKMRDLWEVVGRLDAAEVLVDERPVPYARELWLPLAWFLVR